VLDGTTAKMVDLVFCGKPEDASHDAKFGLSAVLEETGGSGDRSGVKVIGGKRTQDPSLEVMDGL
jgi:hypothetical protein